MFLISKYTQPSLGNAFANKHVPAEMIGVEQINFFVALYFIFKLHFLIRRNAGSEREPAVYIACRLS
jgi:hypothetical protein